MSAGSTTAPMPVSHSGNVTIHSDGEHSNRDCGIADTPDQGRPPRF